MQYLFVIVNLDCNELPSKLRFKTNSADLLKGLRIVKFRSYRTFEIRNTRI